MIDTLSLLESVAYIGLTANSLDTQTDGYFFLLNFSFY